MLQRRHSAGLPLRCAPGWESLVGFAQIAANGLVNVAFEAVARFRSLVTVSVSGAGAAGKRRQTRPRGDALQQRPQCEARRARGASGKRGGGFELGVEGSAGVTDLRVGVREARDEGSTCSRPEPCERGDGGAPHLLLGGGQERHKMFGLEGREHTPR